jgi:DNA-binding winged helix-turn-helix (wHTH) protein
MPGLVTYTFGPFGFDLANRRLSYGGTVVRLKQAPTSVLVYFLEHPGEMLSKNTLISAVWEDTAVTDNSLDKAISLLRRAGRPRRVWQLHRHVSG